MVLLYACVSDMGPSLLLHFCSSCVAGNERFRNYIDSNKVSRSSVIRYQSFPHKTANLHSSSIVYCTLLVQDMYIQCNEQDKLKVLKSVLIKLKSINRLSRFLEQDSCTKMWREISDERALSKIARRMRDPNVAAKPPRQTPQPNCVENPGDNDILCGRVGNSYEHRT